METPFPRDELAVCLGRAMRTSFYRERLGAETHRNWVGFRRIPLTRKEDIRKHGSAAFLALHEGLCQYHETYGTTGRPSGSWFTARDYANDLGRVRHWSRPFFGRRVMIRFPYSLSMPAHLAQRAVEAEDGAIIAASSRTSVCSYPRAARLVEHLKVEAIAGSPFDLLLLAEASRQLGLSLESVRAVSVAGELLTAGYHNAVSEAFGVPVYNLYGSTETAAIATSCDRGRLHACEGQLVEILSASDHTPQPPGVVGEVAVTTLDREAMPLLRYATGDFATWDPAESCGCGREGIVIEPHGRFVTDASGGPRCERDALDLAFRVAKRAGARFFEAHLEAETLHLRVEQSEPVAATGTSLPPGVELQWVSLGTLVDRDALLAEPAQGKPRLITHGGENRPQWVGAQPGRAQIHH